MKELSLLNCRLDGRYDIQELLGRGSYAEIYIARDTHASPQSPHTTVVIKALNVFLQDDLDAELERTLVANFQNEAVALDRVRHPNIISRLGHGTARDLDQTVFHYLVLEYLPGGDMAKLRQKGGLNPLKSLNYLEQVCAGLAHAHKCGVIHRDIKPQNLLLTGDLKVVKIADFGVAKLSSGDSPITRVGTNMYAPPEHSPIFADVAEVMTVTELTPAADIYSLAKSAYVLVTGDSPRRFTNSPIGSLPPSCADKPWSPNFLSIIQKSTRNDPRQRYQTVNDFWQDMAYVQLAVEREEAEPETQVSLKPQLVPQAANSKDFSPLSPLRPNFNTAKDLKVSGLLAPDLLRSEENNGLREEENNRLRQEENNRLRVRINSESATPVVAAPEEPAQPVIIVESPVEKPVRGRRLYFLRRVAIFLVLIGTLALALFATQSYIRNGRILPKTLNPFAKAEGVATSNVNLRASNDADSQKIGLVPKGSRVRIRNVKDDWMEVDIIELSRPKDNAGDSDHGWVNKKYFDIQE